MASNYVKGRSKEYEAISLLRSLGYECTRAASSKGLADVVAMRADEGRLVQVKFTSTGDFSEDANCRELRDLPVPPNIRKELWLYVKGKGLYEVRDLKEPYLDRRTQEGKEQAKRDRERARQTKALFKVRRMKA